MQESKITSFIKTAEQLTKKFPLINASLVLTRELAERTQHMTSDYDEIEPTIEKPAIYDDAAQEYIPLLNRTSISSAYGTFHWHKDEIKVMPDEESEQKTLQKIFS